MPLLSRNQISLLMQDIFVTSNVSANGRNRYSILFPEREMMVWVSQTKSSSSGKGHWKYDFWNTMKMETLEEILDSSGVMVMVNYVKMEYIVLNPSDIAWAIRYSSRVKSNEGAVTDFVVDIGMHPSYNLRPYDRLRRERRAVRSWKIEE